MRTRTLVLFAVFLVTGVTRAQDVSSGTSAVKWWNPVAAGFAAIEGQAWPREVGAAYDRFPARAEKTVNANVWNISHSAAGLLIRFKTNARHITVRYGVTGAFAMDHMPATGVSGVDLYALDKDGQWQWASARFSFADTIVYRYANLDGGDQYDGKGCEYRLYLPLYNAVTWLEIGVPDDARFDPLPARNEKPIVVYGTSIAQGACASRPGMAWTAMLGRAMDRPVVNLGFSGSGKLEDAVIDLLNEIDAKVYVLDCLPNMTAGAGFSPEEVNKRIVASVHRIREKHPRTPVLLAAHSGIAAHHMEERKRTYQANVNDVLEEAFAQLQAAGVKDLYRLSNAAIGFDIEATVDGVHPNDMGMQRYAAAYEAILRDILKEPVASYATTQPRVQYRDGYYNWEERHNRLLKMNAEQPPRIVFFGNSITHYWGGEPAAPLARGGGSWSKISGSSDVRNFGFGWDRIENVLWRVYHDELDGYRADKVLILIGTNDLPVRTDHEITEGLRWLVQAVRVRQPGVPVLLLGLLPRRDMEARIQELNKSVARLAGEMNITYADPGASLLNKKGKIDEMLFEDGLHPNEQGYRRIADKLTPVMSVK